MVMKLPGALSLFQKYPNVVFLAMTKLDSLVGYILKVGLVLNLAKSIISATILTVIRLHGKPIFVVSPYVESPDDTSRSLAVFVKTCFHFLSRKYFYLL